jgi:hypothetical protein
LAAGLVTVEATSRVRDVGEGQRPMNDPRGQTMTNATVTGAVVVNGSNHTRVKFDGGESDSFSIRVSPSPASKRLASVS